MESILYKYFNSFFNNKNDKLLLNFKFDSNNHTYINKNDRWFDLEKEYNELLYNGLENFNMVIEKNASFFIRNIFKKHVDSNTFVIGSMVHSTVSEEINKSLNKYILTYNDIKDFNINKLILKYKESGCNKLFIYLSSLVNQQLILQSFCYILKKELIEQDINHIIVFDDVATMFIIPKDYSPFDYVIYTCHSLIPTFDSGLLFYKNNITIDFGYKDYEIAKAYLMPLNLLLSKKDKIYLFNIILSQYFAEEISSKLFKIPEYTTPNIFCLMFNNNITNIINRYKEELNKYNIDCADYNINIRCSHFISQDIDKIIEGLKKLKIILQKCIKLSKLQ